MLGKRGGGPFGKSKFDSRNDSTSYQSGEVIIHRTANSIMTNYLEDHLRKRQGQIKDNETKGWRAPNDKPYRPLGDFCNVIPVVEKMKTTFPHAKEMDAQTQQNIKYLKKSKNPTIGGNSPPRTVEILNSNSNYLKKIKEI